MPTTPVKPPNAVAVARKATEGIKTCSSESGPAANDINIVTSL